jgi:hypothetical protein
MIDYYSSSYVYITVAFIALALVALILIRKKKRHRNLSSVATTAVLLNIAGIIVGETEILNYAFGYGFMSVGLILSIVGMLQNKK